MKKIVSTTRTKEMRELLHFYRVENAKLAFKLGMIDELQFLIYLSQKD